MHLTPSIHCCTALRLALRPFRWHACGCPHAQVLTSQSYLLRSGMLPGFVSGFYSFDDCHVDLARLAQYARATLILASATSLDLEARPELFPSVCFLRAKDKKTTTPLFLLRTLACTAHTNEATAPAHGHARQTKTG